MSAWSDDFVTDFSALTQSRSEVGVVASQSVRAVDELRAIYDGHVGYVLATLRRLGVDARDREDLAHDVFIVVAQRWHCYDAQRPLKPWLFGIAFRVALAHKRLARTSREIVGDDASEQVLADPTPDAEQRLEAAQRRRLVEQALLAVALDRRGVLILHDVEGSNMADIAAALDLPINTAYSRLRLARKDFADAVARRPPRHKPSYGSASRRRKPRPPRLQK